MLGGHPGACSEIRLGDGRIPHPKSRTVIGPGERLNMHYAGGGGFGDPGERDPAAVRADVENGYVSAHAARATYGLGADE